MRVQFRCCLCGQQNTADIDREADRLVPRRGWLSQFLDWFRTRPVGRKRYSVQCSFCSQNNAISAPSLPTRPPE